MIGSNIKINRSKRCRFNCTCIRANSRWLYCEIILKNEKCCFIDYLTVGVIPKHILDGEDITTCDFNRNPIGTGPYKLSNWDEGQSITLVKNEDYFRNDPKNW